VEVSIVALNIPGNSSIFSFSPNHPPVLRVPSGTTVELQTLDCFANQLQTPADTLDAINWEHVNPATGPVFVEGASPGGALKVTIERIRIGTQGVMATGKDFGTFGDQFDKIHSKIFPIREGKVVFDDKLLIPIRPMIGVIGVAPADQDLNCGTPGPHGGNMDNRLIGEGTTLYLPVFVDGALFALGDLHAVMGDGEVAVSGLEIAGSVTVKLEFLPDLSL
jgi:amidase